MPIPFILGAFAVGSGLIGVAGAIDAKETLKQAKLIVEEGKECVKESEQKVESSKRNTNIRIEELGKEKISIMAGNIKSFVDIFSKLKNVNFKDSVGMEELRNFTPDSSSIKELRLASISAAQIIGGATTGLTGGGITALGAYGAVSTLATASTGTAIGTLSGVAATNATLAWFGGGSIASGGLGMAAGTAVLGGIVLGPALLVSGIIASSKADEELSKAKTYRAKVEQFRSECMHVESVLRAISTRATQITEILKRLDRQSNVYNNKLKAIVKTQGYDYSAYSVEDKKYVASAAMAIKTLKVVLDTPLLHEKNGTLTEKSAMIIKQYGK
jgi:transmembrane protein